MNVNLLIATFCRYGVQTITLGIRYLCDFVIECWVLDVRSWMLEVGY